MRKLVRRGIGYGVIGKIDIYICLTRKEGVNSRDMHIRHSLAEHYGLQIGVKALYKGVFLTRLVVCGYELVVHLGIGIGHYREILLSEAYLVHLFFYILCENTCRVIKLLGAHLGALYTELFVKRAAVVSRCKSDGKCGKKEREYRQKRHAKDSHLTPRIRKSSVGYSYKHHQYKRNRNYHRLGKREGYPSRKLCKYRAVYRRYISVEKVGKGLAYNICCKKQCRHSSAEVKYLRKARYLTPKALCIFLFFLARVGNYLRRAHFFIVHKISSPLQI